MKGRTAAGSRSGMSKLSESIVLQMRAKYWAGGITRNGLAGQYGVHKSTVDRILGGRGWRHVVQAQPST